MIAKILFGTAVVAGSLILGAAPADAQPNQSDHTPSPFVGLGTTTTQQPGPAPGDPAFMAELQRGLLAGAAR
jgi:hypothetical protein